MFFLVTARTSQGLYPVLPPTPTAVQPSAPPCDEGYGGSESSSNDSSRGVVRPHSATPFLRNVRPRTILEEDIDVEGISCLLNFSTRGISATQTPAAAPRPDRPPRISSRRILPIDTPRPTALRRQSSPALGAPLQQEEETDDLPDIPDTPQSLAVSDVTVLRLVLFLYFFFRKNLLLGIIFLFLMLTFFFSTLSSPARSESPWIHSGGYSSDDLSEYEYEDPYEGEGPYSQTPPPLCEDPAHELCVPPAWGERIPGSPVHCRCVLCHKDNLHHGIRCIQCMNAP